MPRDYKFYLKDIIASALFIEEQVAGLNAEDFSTDEVRLRAILYSLTIIGEAVKHIPDDVRHRLEDIPWQAIAGTRDIIIHGYFTLKLPILWQAVQHEVPQLRQQIEGLLATLEDEDPEAQEEDD